MHTSFKPARRGLFDTKITEAKTARLTKNLGSFLGLADPLLHSVQAAFQHRHLSYSENGDFTGSFRGGIKL